MWVLIDNYDSFTHILHHYLLQAGGDCHIFRNDEITIGELESIAPSRIILSPGPETPLQAGITMDVISRFYDSTPILGVCLGHQALGMYFGAALKHAHAPMHGKSSEICIDLPHPLFEGIMNATTVMRYHSLIIEKLDNTGLQCLATSADTHEIMAIAHKKYPCTGVQFHPESVGTPDGLRMIQNWATMR